MERPEGDVIAVEIENPLSNVRTVGDLVRALSNFPCDAELRVISFGTINSMPAHLRVKHGNVYSRVWFAR